MKQLFGPLFGSLCLISLMLLAYYRPFHHKEAVSTMLTGQAMTLDYHITFGTVLDLEQLTRAEQEILTSFEEIHAICNQWNKDSLISRCNQMSAGERQAIPPLLQQLLLTAHLVSQLSHGHYDLTIEPLKALWLNSLQKGEEPSAKQLAELAPQMGWHQLHVENGWLSKDHDKLALNLDSIAKGLCVDLLTERLVAKGFKDLLVEWGGEVRAAGYHPNNRPWQLFIRRLEDPDPTHALAIIPLENAALATSGDYVQHWTLPTQRGGEVEEQKKENVTYFHLFDPNTLRPLTKHPGSIASVTVRAPTCALADALATAGMFCESLDEAQEWAHAVQKQFPDTAFWFAARR